MLHNLSPNQIFTLQNSQINTLKLFVASLLSVLNAFALKITATNQEQSTPPLGRGVFQVFKKTRWIISLHDPCTSI